MVKKCAIYNQMYAFPVPVESLYIAKNIYTFLFSLRTKETQDPHNEFFYSCVTW